MASVISWSTYAQVGDFRAQSSRSITVFTGSTQLGRALLDLRLSSGDFDLAGL